MTIDLEKQVLPKTYMRNDKACYLDLIREKLIYITPEETVRQKVISYLINTLKVPKELIAVEMRLSHYGLKSSKRADIIVHRYDENRNMVAVAVVECKAPNVYLGDKALNQMLDYCDELGCDYAMMVNGYESFCYKFNESQNIYKEIEQLPIFTDMIEGKSSPEVVEEAYSRVPFEKHEEYINDLRERFDGEFFADISPMTKMQIAKPALNLWECLLDCSVKMPTGKYEFFNLVEDYGVRLLDYGNASGGTFFGPYRSFLIEKNGNTEFVSFSITTYWKGNDTTRVKTCLAVGIDNEKTTHHSLQLVLDDNLGVNGENCKFYHHGKIAVGNIGSGKVDELRLFVAERYPKIIYGNRFLMGILRNDRLWKLDDPEVIELIENLIAYALIRDEYREYVKKKRSRK